MRFSLAAAAALVPVLFASAEDHLIQVGAGAKLVFSPSNITAKAGDNILFQFQGKNHSVTQSTFGVPCAPQTVPAQGISSGFQFVAPNATELPQWNFTIVNDTSPLWFYCAQTTPADHCQMGMVFSINANENSNKSFAAYQALAMNSAAAGGAAAGGAPAGGAAAGGAAPSGASSGASAGPTDSAGAGGSAAQTGAPGAPTDGPGAISSTLTNPSGLLGGDNGSGASPTSAVGAAGNSTGNSTGAPSAGVRVSGSAMSLVAAIGLTAMLL
ncbi:Cupredoxin [Mycena capillaripes]|nr:Cupredoxin [Mycena capillaripes]